jgi:hypothetical protein
MIMQAKACRRRVVANEVACQACQNLLKEGYLPGILKRLMNGIHESTALIFQGMAGLKEVIERKDKQIKNHRFTKLNVMKKLGGKLTVIGEQKRLIMGIASGKAQNVHILLQVSMKNRHGLRGMLTMYTEASEGSYHPKDFTESAVMKGILLWRLGGIRLAHFGHLALVSPSQTTHVVCGLFFVTPQYLR